MVSTQHLRVATAAAVIAIVMSFSASARPDKEWRRSLKYDELTDPNWPNRRTDQATNSNVTVGEWKIARATFAYNHDNMDINQAACRFGTIDPSADGGRGLQVAAMSDVNPDYAGSCGKCFEFRCANMVFSDNYGASIDRSDACYDTTGSLVIKIIDTCPCNYPQNQHSNKRWCCGDMTHFDTSYWAMLKFANPQLGVIGLNYRAVPCNYQPLNDLGPIGDPPGYPQATTYPVQYENRTSFPAPPATVTAAFNRSYAEQQASPKATATMRPNATANATSSMAMPPPAANVSSAFNVTTPAAPQPGGMMGEMVETPEQGGTHPIFQESALASGWSDASTSVSTAPMQTGSSGTGSAKCSTIQPGGSIGFKGPAGSFENMLSLAFNVRKAGSGGGIPNLNVNIGGDSASCDTVALSSLERSVGGTSDNAAWSKYDVYLGNFGSASDASSGMVEAFAAAFDGCGGLQASQLNKVQFINAGGMPQSVCVDQVQLLG